MLPSAGILLRERLYIGMYIVSVSDETASEYATNNNGLITFQILDGRGKLFNANLDSKKVNSVSRNTNITFGGLNGGTDSDRNTNVETIGYNYTLTIKDIATNISNTVTVHIGYGGSGSWVIYNGTKYTSGQRFHFLLHR
jgi:hypothetical protein